jgi:hypothetical protein
MIIIPAAPAPAFAPTIPPCTRCDGAGYVPVLHETFRMQCALCCGNGFISPFNFTTLITTKD